MFGGMGGLGGAAELDLIIRAIDQASDVFGTITGGLEHIISTTASWQSSLAQVQVNTTLSSGDIAKMGETIRAMNAESGAPLDQLAQAFRQINDITGSMAATTAIAQVAQKGATGTYGDQVEVATILANAMHEYGTDTSTASTAAQRNAEITANATRTMGELILGAQSSGVAMKQFADAMSQATAWGANLGVPLTDIIAGMATLTKHGLDATQAGTQLRNEFSHIVAPSAAARAELAQLSAQSGVNLVADFTTGGLATKHLTGVLADLHEAETRVGLSGADAAGETMKLIPAMRGSLGAIIELGTGGSDYATILARVSDTTKANAVVQQDYQLVLGTFDQKMAIINGNWNQFLLDIGKPIIDSLTPYLNTLISWIQTHEPEIKAFGMLIGKTIGDDVTNFVKAVPGIFDAVNTEVGKFDKLGAGVKSFFDTLGTDILQMEAGIVGALFDLSKSIEHSITAPVNAIRERLGMGDAPDPYSDQAALAKQRFDFLHSLGLAPIDLATAATVHGGGGPAINPLTGRPYQGGGGGDYWNPVTGKYQADPYVPATGGGGGGGNRNNDPNNPDNANNSNYLDAQRAIAAATRTLRDAQDRFGIDLTTHQTQLGQSAVHRLLTGDISAIIKDMVPLLGYDTLDRQKAQVDYLAQIADHTKTAATHLGAATGQATNPLLGFRLPQEAAYGGNIISFQSLQEASNREDRRQLMAQVAALQQQNAALQQQNAALQEGNGHAAATAQATARIASTAGRTPQSVDSFLRRNATSAVIR